MTHLESQLRASTGEAMRTTESPESLAERCLLIASTHGMFPNDVTIAEMLRQWREAIRSAALEEAAEWIGRNVPDEPTERTPVEQALAEAEHELLRLAQVKP